MTNSRWTLLRTRMVNGPGVSSSYDYFLVHWDAGGRMHGTVDSVARIDRLTESGDWMVSCCPSSTRFATRTLADRWLIDHLNQLLRTEKETAAGGPTG